MPATPWRSPIRCPRRYPTHTDQVDRLALSHAPSSPPPTRPSPPSCASRSGSMSIRQRMPIVLSVDEKSQIQALDRTQPGPADEEGPRRHDDPRLQAQRHDHAVRRAQPPGRLGDRPVHAAPSAPGVHPLPQPVRARRAARQAHPCRARQLRHPQASPRSVPGSSVIRRWTFHFTPDLGIMAERRRRLLRQADPAAPSARSCAWRWAPLQIHAQ